MMVVRMSSRFQPCFTARGAATTIVALVLAGSTVRPVWAEPAAPGAEPGQDTGPAGPDASAAGAPQPADLGALWQQAQSRLATSDYDEAIVLLTRVYDAVASDPEAAALRLRVQWTLHQAHVGAHRVDGDLEHLYVARDLLTKYRQALPETEIEQAAQAEAAQQDVEARIAEQEAAEALAAQRAAEQAEAEAARIAAVEAAEAAEPTPESEPEPQVVPLPSRGLIIGGAVAAGLGFAGLGVMAGGLGFSNAAVTTFETEPDRRAQAREDIRRGNTIGIVGAVAGGALLVGGSVALALGIRRRSAAHGSLAAGPGQAGVAWRLRF